MVNSVEDGLNSDPADARYPGEPHESSSSRSTSSSGSGSACEASPTRMHPCPGTPMSPIDPPSPLHPPKRWHGCPLPITLALVPGLLMCLVGFLAWGLPFSNLTSAIEPLAQSVRRRVLATISINLQQTWMLMHHLILQHRVRWDIAGQPMDVLADGPVFARAQYPIMLLQDNIVACHTTGYRNGCMFITALHQLSDGWLMDRQNCTHRWLERWDETTYSLTGEVITALPYLNISVNYPLRRAINQSNPFTWTAIFDPQSGIGNVLSANVGLFENGELFGFAGVSVATSYLRTLIQNMLSGPSVTQGGRLALFEGNGLVVAASHGSFDKSQRLNLTEIGDPDLEAAAEYMLRTYGSLCMPVETEVKLSVPYFLDVVQITDPHPSFLPLQWCAILLSPRRNILASVDNSRVFAIIFVCVMMGGVTLLFITLGVLVTRPMQELALGMAALQRYEVEAARAARNGTSVFKELSIAQASYDSLVDAIDAFGKYVPQTVVRGLLAGVVPSMLRMDEKEVAVAFLDLENFTSMCEVTETQEIVALSCHLFDTCFHIILETGGSIDKFIGDCMMALWGAPTSMRSPGLKAAHAILDILTFLRDHPLALQSGVPLRFRIGVHSGTCLVGNFGATARWDYTAVGDVVNSAARLEPLNKQFGTHCLISAAVADQLKPSEELLKHMRPLGSVLLTGKQQPLEVYEMLDSPVSDREGWVDAMAHFQAGRFSHALSYFQKLPEDTAARVLLEEIIDAQNTGAKGPTLRLMRHK